MRDYITLWDLFLVPAYLGLILFLAGRIKRKHISIYPEFKYFRRGLFLKLTGAIALSMVYVYYYKGGDTMNYYDGAAALVNMFTYDFEVFWNIMVNNELTYANYSVFDTNTGWPHWQLFRSSETFSVCRFSVLFGFMGFNSFLVMGMLTACFSYFGIWKLYRLFNMLYPGNARAFAWTILFLPSLAFWGSGIMKDTFVLGAVCWVTCNFYHAFIRREKLMLNLLLLVMNVGIIISLKPYVFLCLLPGMLFWLNSAYMQKIPNPMLKTLALPFLVAVIGLVGYFTLSSLSVSLGVYGDVNTAVKQAQIIQQDLLRAEQYGGNNYYLGQIDGSIGNMMALAPAAVLTAIYRPMFWEIGSPTMVISAIENSVLLLFSLFLLIRVNPIKCVRIILSEPILLYALVFSIMLAFGVGIASTNFGALARYKIPLIPFYFSMLYVVYVKSKGRSMDIV